MNEENEKGLSPAFLAAERLAEIDALSRSLRQILADMIADIEVGGQTTVAETIKKLNELQAAHLKVLAAEDTFHAKIGTDPDAVAIDYDSVRLELGRRLDRLRASLLAEAVSRDADAGAVGDIALSLRLLGDAASNSSAQ